jgi:imidazolonepropionase-like amidohydrolase
MRSNNLKICLGTDSLSSNTVLSMVDEMLTLQKYFPSVPLEEMIQWATINGAEFLKKDSELGTLEVGKKPGIVLIENMDLQNMKLTEKSTSRRLA